MRESEVRQEKEFVITMSRRGAALTAPALVSKGSCSGRAGGGGSGFPRRWLLEPGGRGGKADRALHCHWVSARVLGEALGGRELPGDC